MDIEKKAPTKSGTTSVALTFSLNASLSHNFKQGVPVHFEIWAAGQTVGSNTADKGHSAKRCKFTITFDLWLGPKILFTDLFWSVPRFPLNFRKMRESLGTDQNIKGHKILLQASNRILIDVMGHAMMGFKSRLWVLRQDQHLETIFRQSCFRLAISLLLLVSVSVGGSTPYEHGSSSQRVPSHAGTAWQSLRWDPKPSGFSSQLWQMRPFATDPAAPSQSFK